MCFMKGVRIVKETKKNFFSRTRFLYKCLIFRIKKFYKFFFERGAFRRAKGNKLKLVLNIKNC